ncbi:hypothetical protein ONE63_001026 [Megalurothrips usitatus]|uniref:Uncharacterized protein n=1 Tax=Megalurothrips usitatus TaxID=439358 RepID=A0AAV7XEJ4_9NEOP|nr:hypothetical protein ONE63_001026 [Megalurothrips usitatus]
MPAPPLHVTAGPAPRPHPGVSLGRYVLDALKEHVALSIPAQVDSETGREMSFPELLRQSVAAAEGWRRLGLTSGDTLAVFSAHNHFLYPAFFGAVFEGTKIAIIKHSTPEELRHFLSLCRPKAILTEPANLATTMAAQPDNLPLVVSAAQVPTDLHMAVGTRALSVPELVALGGAATPATYRPGYDGDPKAHDAFLLFSSGSSGLPKLVRLSDFSFTMTMLFMGTWMLRPGDRMFITSQLSWATGLTFTFTSTVLGVTRVYGWFGQDYGEKDWMDIVQKNKVSAWFVPPVGLTLLATEARARRSRGEPVPLSSLRVLISTGSGLHADAQRYFSEVLGTPVVQWYGITEAGIITADALPARPGSTGRLTPGIRLRLVDVDSGLDVEEPNTIGEVRVTSPAYMSGYSGADNPDETSASLDEHGFFCTGDLAYRDADGYLFLVDRIKDQIKFDNMPLAPAEVEAVLLSHPGVKEACVTGRPDQLRLVDLATAFVVRQPGAAEVSEAELQAQQAQARLSYEKWLYGGVFFREQIPMTANGKADRRQLRDWLKALPPPQNDRK